MVGTKFRAGGFSGFLPGPVAALTGRVLTLAQSFGAAGAELDAALAAPADFSSIVTEVSRFLRAHRPAPDPERLLAMEIVDAMRVAAPGTRIAHVAARFGMSPRTLQRLFAKHVGTTPKHVLQRFRRQRAVDHLSEESRANLARLAAELGYCDQAHLARDFRATIGRSPSAVAASRSDAPAEGFQTAQSCL